MIIFQQLIESPINRNGISSLTLWSFVPSSIWLALSAFTKFLIDIGWEPFKSPDDSEPRKLYQPASEQFLHLSLCIQHIRKKMFLFLLFLI